jgi:hypothetical protein
MPDLIDTLAAEIAARTPLDATQARTVLAGALALIQKHGVQEKVAALLAGVPGAEALAASAPALPKRGLLGGMMSAAGGGAMADGMAMMQQLSKSGVSSTDLQQALPVAVQWVQAHTGSDLLGEALTSIPGVGGLLSRG